MMDDIEPTDNAFDATTSDYDDDDVLDQDQEEEEELQNVNNQQEENVETNITTTTNDIDDSSSNAKLSVGGDDDEKHPKSTINKNQEQVSISNQSIVIDSKLEKTIDNSQHHKKEKNFTFKSETKEEINFPKKEKEEDLIGKLERKFEKIVKKESMKFESKVMSQIIKKLKKEFTRKPTILLNSNVKLHSDVIQFFQTYEKQTLNEWTETNQEQSILSLSETHKFILQHLESAVSNEIKKEEGEIFKHSIFRELSELPSFTTLRSEALAKNIRNMLNQVNCKHLFDEIEKKCWEERQTKWISEEDFTSLLENIFWMKIIPKTMKFDFSLPNQCFTEIGYVENFGWCKPSELQHRGRRGYGEIKGVLMPRILYECDDCLAVPGWYVHIVSE